MAAELFQKLQHWPLHLFFEISAYFFGYRYYLLLRNRHADPISASHRLWILAAAAAGALLFSRMLALLEHPELLQLRGFNALAIFSHKTIVGGLLGGLLGVELIKKYLGVRVSSGDLLTYPLLLGMILGRVGCFFAGPQDGTHGIATGLPWGIDFGDGVVRHPTNLYEIIFLALLWGGLRWTERSYRLADGSRFKIFMTAYLGFRFFIEWIKPSPEVAWGLSAIQWACLGGLIYYAWVLLKAPIFLSAQTREA